VPKNMTPDIPGSPICSEDRAAGKFIALPQEISADPWRQGNADGRQRPRREVGREVGWSRSSEEAANHRGAKGIMKMRTMKSEQLSRVFADSPKGGQSEETLVLTRDESPRLHKASDKEFNESMAGGIRSRGSEISSKEPDARSASPVLREGRPCKRPPLLDG